jgi:hypothetical protein
MNTHDAVRLCASLSVYLCVCIHLGVGMLVRLSLSVAALRLWLASWQARSVAWD